MQIDVSTHEPSSTWFNFGSDLPVELSTQLKWVWKKKHSKLQIGDRIDLKLLAEKKVSNTTIYTRAVILARI